MRQEQDQRLLDIPIGDELLLVILVLGMVLALAFGIWAGLGFPGRYDKYESTGRAPRRTPFVMLMDWIVSKLDR